MSRNRKNNHYHYAEKFEDRKRRSSNGKRAFMPFKSVIISLVVLLMFGLTCTTFSVYVSENDPEYNPEEPSIITEVRNLKASREVAYTGAGIDLAATGATWSFSGGYMYFVDPGWSQTYVQLIIGKGTSGDSSWSACYTMSKVTNTSYYVVALPSSGWGDATYMAVIGNSSEWDGGKWGTSNLTNATKRTAAYTAGITSTSDQRYTFTPASASNDVALTLDYKGTGNSAMDTVTLAAHACYTTNGSSYTADNSTGGTVNITSYYFSAYNAVSSSSTGASATASYNAAKTTSSVNSTFTATAATGYRFQGWYTAATGGSLVSSSATYSYSTNSGNKEVYARFIKRVTITAAKNPTSYTGSPTADGSSSGTTVDTNTAVTLNADVKTGVTFDGWSFTGTKTFVTGYSASSNPTQIKATTNVTATAKYILNTPTISGFSYASTTEGASAISPTKTATSAAGSSGSLSYAYSYVSGPSDGSYNLNASTGAFSATVAGTYTVRLTVTDTAYGLTSSSVTQDYAITVKPTPLTISDIDKVVDNNDSGAGTVASPWKVPVRSVIFFIRTYILETSLDNNYTYNWTRTDGTFVKNNGVIQSTTPGSQSATTNNVTEVTDVSSDCTQSGQVIHNTKLSDDENEGYYYKVSIKKKRNNVESEALDIYYYYSVTTDFLHVTKFDFSSFNSNTNEEVQKIYDENNNIDHIVATYNAGGTKFDTILKFSNNNINYNTVAVWTKGRPDQNSDSFTVGSSGGIFAGTYSALPNDVAHQVDTLIPSLSTIARNNVNLMSTTGPKWFKGYFDDYENTTLSPRVEDVFNANKTIRHTTVGTSSVVADRPIYYIENPYVTITDSRVMAFYLEDGDNTVHYQTGQVVSGRTGTYRFYVPYDTTYIAFAHVAVNSYLLPTFGGSSFSYAVSNNSVLKAWTETVDLSDSANANKTTYQTTGYTQNGTTQIYNYTGIMTTLS